MEVHGEVGGVKGVIALLRHKRIIAGAEAELVSVAVGVEAHRVAKEVRKEVDMAAAYAGADTVHRALMVAAIAEAAGELGVDDAVGVASVGLWTRIAPEIPYGAAAAKNKEGSSWRWRSGTRSCC